MGRPTSEELETAKETLDGLISRAEDLCSQLETASADTTKHTQTAQTRAEEAATYLKEIETAKTSAQTAKEEVDTLKQSATQSETSITSLATRSEQIDNTLTEQEQQLHATAKQADDLRDTIEHLLPGATSAGLASAFRERKESFIIPKRIWGVVFVAAVLSLVFVAYIDPITLESESVTYQTIIPYILERLPFIIPIVWLAIYAGRRHSQALRLEEEYAHKEVLSKSFEGYKQQLLEIEADVGDKQKTLSLIDRTLTALAIHPGRIYQGKHEDITPWSSLKGVLGREKSSNDNPET